MSRALVRLLIPRVVRRFLRRSKERMGFEHRFLRLRRPGLRALRGTGFEIGAFEHPAPVPRGCRVAYVDAITPQEAKRRFPEIDTARLVPIDHLVDIDRDGLKVLPDGSQDFAIACHVIEHVANPGRLVAEMIRVLKPGGRLVIAAPDRDHTFDRNRPVTPLETLKRYFLEGRPPVTPEDYRDIVDYIHPELAAKPAEELAAALERYHHRREHLSVWTATGFREFLLAAFEWAGVAMAPEYEVLSDRNLFEYFGVWIRGASRKPHDRIPPCPPVCAVVVTYHPDASAAGRLRAILSQCARVIVVDNGSSAEALAALPSEVEVVRLGTNRGLAAALNIGLARARALGFSWAVTFDQDSTPESGMVEALWLTRVQQPAPERVAVVGPRLREERVEHEDHRWVVPHARWRWLFHRAPCVACDLPGVAFVITSGALMDLEILQEIGPMDEGLFIDYIDHDYCLRARRSGYDIVVSAGAFLAHNLGAKRECRVAGRLVRPTFHSPLRLRYMARNRIHMWRRYARRFPHWALFDGVFGAYNMLRVVIFEDLRFTKLVAALRGTWDGVVGRLGQLPP